MVFLLTFFSSFFKIRGIVIVDDIMLISTSMTFYTIVKIGNSFFTVFAYNVAFSMLVTTITGVIFVISSSVASGTFCVVVSIKNKIFGMFKIGRSPFVG